jgi:DMSO/TMAO reductase YedYZ heme-binding membrane subunit
VSTNRTPAQAIRHGIHGVRFYIGLASILITFEAWWWAEASYAGSILFATRLEEFYAWMAVGLLTLAVAIGPFYNVWPKARGRAVLYDARRWLGISAAWFAALHASIAYISLFKAANPLTLPIDYRHAFWLGGLALVMLLAMAATSFDAAFRGMGVWWYRLHRLVYLAVIFSLFHAFMIGVHAAQWLALLVLSGAAVFIFSLHFYLGIIRPAQPKVGRLVAIVAMLLMLLAVFNYGFGQKLGYNPIEGKHHHSQ